MIKTVETALPQNGRMRVTQRRPDTMGGAWGGGVGTITSIFGTITC